MCFKLDNAIYSLRGKLADHFTYFGSNILSTEDDVNICIVMAWTDIDKLSTIRKTDLSDKLKQTFFKL